MSRAPSVHLSFNDRGQGDILTQTALIPDYADAVNTYYCTMNWNTGQDGGGYCGLQHRNDGTCFIFSLWHPPHSNDHVRLVYHSPSTQVAPFGGEGTGLRSLNFQFGWSKNRWYTLVTRVWSAGSNTHFGLWVKDTAYGRWEHQATFEYPRPNVRFSGGTVSFVEDFIGNGQDVRGLWTKDGFKRTHPGTWEPYTSGYFTVTKEASASQHANNYDSQVTATEFYMATGGSISPSAGVHNGATVKISGAPHHSPQQPAIAFSIISASTHSVSWHVPESSTPQFSFNVKVNGHVVAAGDDPQRRNATFSGSAGHKLELTLEDIMGNTTTLSHTI